MGEKRRQFTAEFKLETVRMASDSDKPLSQVARELGIRPDMLRAWRRQAQSRAGLAPGDVFPGNGMLTSQEEEIRALRREVEVLIHQPGRLVVGGASCQPWKADVVFQPIPPSRFAAYAEPDQVKIAWTLDCQPLAPHRADTRSLSWTGAPNRCAAGDSRPAVRSAASADCAPAARA